MRMVHRLSIMIPLYATQLLPAICPESQHPIEAILWITNNFKTTIWNTHLDWMMPRKNNEMMFQYRNSVTSRLPPGVHYIPLLHPSTWSSGQQFFSTACGMPLESWLVMPYLALDFCNLKLFRRAHYQKFLFSVPFGKLFFVWFPMKSHICDADFLSPRIFPICMRGWDYMHIPKFLKLYDQVS